MGKTGMGKLLQKWQASVCSDKLAWWRDLLKLLDIYKGLASALPLVNMSSFGTMFGMECCQSLNILNSTPLPRINVFPCKRQKQWDPIFIRFSMFHITESPASAENDRWVYIWGTDHYSCSRAQAA